jgi:hypothetical protein
MTDGVYIGYGLLFAISVSSIIFALRAMLVLRDSQYACSMIFLRSKEIAKLISTLYWGAAVPLALAMAFTLLDAFFPLALFGYISLTMFILFFIVMNYGIIRGSLVVGGSE